jgi:hypothetical protein
MRWWHLPGAAWQLLRLLHLTRWRWRGRYWSWRKETAFGSDPSRMPDARAQRDAMLEYGRWVGVMRRMR